MRPRRRGRLWLVGAAVFALVGGVLWPLSVGREDVFQLGVGPTWGIVLMSFDQRVGCRFESQRINAWGPSRVEWQSRTRAHDALIPWTFFDVSTAAVFIWVPWWPVVALTLAASFVCYRRSGRRRPEVAHAFEVVPPAA